MGRGFLWWAGFVIALMTSATLLSFILFIFSRDPTDVPRNGPGSLAFEQLGSDMVDFGTSCQSEALSVEEWSPEKSEEVDLFGVNHTTPESNNPGAEILESHSSGAQSHLPVSANISTGNDVPSTCEEELLHTQITSGHVGDYCSATLVGGDGEDGPAKAVPGASSATVVPIGKEVSKAMDTPDHKAVSKTVLSLIDSLSEPDVKSKPDEDVALPKIRCSINLEQCMFRLVWKVAKSFGMKKSRKRSDWDVMWIDVGAGTKSRQAFVNQCLKMKNHQLISHFPGFWCMSAKDLWVRNMQRMQMKFPKEYNVFPRSWVLPRDDLKLNGFAAKHKGMFYIAKPVDSCAGRGIFLTKSVMCKRKMVYQLYLRPFLIDGYKFDFRVYTLLTSCSPLRLYVYNEGIARFASVRYEEPSDANCNNVFMHLTNSCVNTRNPLFIKDELNGHSRRMSGVFRWFKDNLKDPGRIQQAMDDAIVKTMIAVLPTLKASYSFYFPKDASSDRCFEILGFDIMLDHNLDVNVLEVNPSPSFGAITHTPYEAEIKESVVRDAFKILEGNIVNKQSNKNRLNKNPSSLADWESSHMGNFRKIYPPTTNRKKYYQTFINK